MRLRLLGFTILALLLVLLVGLPVLHAQMSDFSKPDRSWNEQITIGLPDDDEDEDDDCPAQPAPVAATGQATSYEAGDDGWYQIGASVEPRFTDNGNGTVTDNLTGVIWKLRAFTDVRAIRPRIPNPMANPASARRSVIPTD